MVKRPELENFLESFLESKDYEDYCPNGLQIEGKELIHRIAFAVSCTKDSVQKALELRADALIVHHGVFWKFQGARPITGPHGARIIPLIKNEINLFGYHLPLDGHQEIGNAATIARKLNLETIMPFGEYKRKPLGVKGKLSKHVKAHELKFILESLLEHPVILSSFDEEKEISSLGIITGGAKHEWELALNEGLDAYLTGEITEHDWNDAKEAGIHMYAGGHHATEKFGIQELMKVVSEKFEVETYFIDSLNPA